LGILGAIIGEKGFYDEEKLLKSEGKGKKATSAYERGVKPDYYATLEHLKIGIQPLKSENGAYTKAMVQYNNGTGMASDEQGGNLMVKEQFIIAPAYRCFILLERMDYTEQKLYDYLKKGWAEYLPYLGKNDFSLWWTNFQEYDIQPATEERSGFEIKTIFIKEAPIKEGKERTRSFDIADNSPGGNKFMYFESLPVGYDTVLWQYHYESFAYTNFSLKPAYKVEGLHSIKPVDGNEQFVIQLF
jgi:CRISPR-associated protein Cas5h